MKREKLPIEGMHCTNCAKSIERAFDKQEDIECHVLLAENAGIFAYDESKWSQAKIGRELRKLGFRLKTDRNVWGPVSLGVSIACTLPLLVLMILMMAGIDLPHWMGYVELGLATVVVALLGVRYWIGAIRDIRQRVLGMDVLISLGTTIAYVYSVVLLFVDHTHELYFDTAAMLLTVITIGKTIEGSVKVKSTAALRALMALQVDTVEILEDGATRIVDVESVEVGQSFLAKQGQTVALDGEVIAGVVEVDESMLTGESLPVTRGVGDQVKAGTMVVQGHATVLVTQAQGDTYLQSIIDRVDRIQQEKPHLQRVADRIATIFVPTVIVLAAVCFAASYWGMGLDVATAIKRAVAVLVISCPCSLGLAAPLSIVIGTTRAGKLGILYSNSEIFEKLRRIDAVCFDKTGTLSTGKLQVVEAHSTPRYDSVGYALESISAHPIALAMCAYWRQNGVTLAPDLVPTEVIGKGVQAGNWFIGKEADVVTLYEKDEVVARWRVADSIQPEAKHTVAQLQRSKVAVYMLTGDNAKTAAKVASDLGIQEECVYSGVLPTQKSDLVAQIQQSGRRVAMVGDGINDSPALSQADFAIAMGEGTDAAKAVADMTVIGGVGRVYEGIRLSRLVYRNIMQNYMWALSYNLVAIPLAFAGILSPLVAGCCMAFSNVTVVLNALRLFAVRLDK